MQDIISILGSDNPKNTTKSSTLRCSLSADMSSKKWLPENGFPLLKKTASSQIAIDSSSSSSSSSELDNNPRRIDIWTAIMSEKKQDGGYVNIPPPYVHPLVKKSSSSLSEKSLTVCTESLGSETGSDVFSCPSSPDDDGHKVGKLTACLPTKKIQQTRSFPPPLATLATARNDGSSIHMQSHRVDGRLVVEAVSIRSQKYFEAQRHDGRFLLTLINNTKEQSSEKEFVDDEDTEIENDNGIWKHGSLNSTSVLSNVHKSKRDNKNSLGSEKIDTKVAFGNPLLPPPPRATGLPPLPRPPAATSINSYQYLWRAKPTVASVIDPLITQHCSPTKTKDLVLLRYNKVDYLLPSLKGCKEPRRSLVMWEPFYIVTS